MRALVLTTPTNPSGEDGAARWAYPLEVWVAAITTAIPVDASYDVTLNLGGVGDTNTIAAPEFPGQMMVLTCKSFVGGSTRIITSAVRINAATNTIMTFNALGDSIGLVGITYGAGTAWQVMFNDGVGLS
jgi:hypothetical protein